MPISEFFHGLRWLQLINLNKKKKWIIKSIQLSLSNQIQKNSHYLTIFIVLNFLLYFLFEEQNVHRTCACVFFSTVSRGERVHKGRENGIEKANERGRMEKARTRGQYSYL